MDINNLQNEIVAWSNATFPSAEREADIKRIIKHMEKELKEIAEDPYDFLEYADVLILLLRACKVAGISGTDLIHYAELKLEVIKKREYGEPDSDGVIEHKK